MITTTFRQATVNFYSFEEWTQLPAWGRDLALGYYSEEDNQIHILKDMKALRNSEDCPSCYRHIPDGYVKCVVYHEYTHFLQWKLGYGKDPMPILPTSKVPLKVLTRKVYDQEDWAIEAEAAYMEHRPQLIEELEAIVKASIKLEEIKEIEVEEDPFNHHLTTLRWDTGKLNSLDIA